MVYYNVYLPIVSCINKKIYSICDDEKIIIKNHKLLLETI